MGQILNNSMCTNNCQDINNFLTKVTPSYFNNKWTINQYNINKTLVENNNFILTNNELILSGKAKPGYIAISKELSILFNKLTSLEIPLNIKINNIDRTMVLVVVTGKHYNIDNIVDDMEKRNNNKNIYFTVLFNSGSNKNTASFSLLSNTNDCEQSEWVNNKTNKYIINIECNQTNYEINQEFSNIVMKKSITNKIDKLSSNFVNNNIAIHVISFYPNGMDDKSSISIKVI